LARIKQDYTPGKLLTGELKAICISHLQEYVKAFQERRTHVTDKVVEDFFARKELIFKGNSG
jgi:tryptophanyl-tRNA synthetase